MSDMRSKAEKIAVEWRGETWKRGAIYALLYIGDSLQDLEKKCTCTRENPVEHSNTSWEDCPKHKDPD